MPLLYELDSPTPTPVWVPSRRQFPEPNAPPGGVATAAQSSAANSPTASLLPVTTTATYSAVNTMSLVYDPTASSQATADITANTTAPKESASDSSNQSIVEKLFTPNGGLFTVGIIIISLAVLSLITCAIVTIRCTLRSRRRSRMQSFTEKNAARRQMSSDRASEFWSAGANESIREQTMFGDSANDPRPPRPARSGETEVDLRAPGKTRFAPNVMVSDHTGLSTDVQLHQSVRSAGPSVDTTQNPGQSDRRAYGNTYALDQDPFAASPIIPVPTTAKPLLPTHPTTSSPYVPNSPHTAGNSPSQFAANFNSSPSNIGSSPSETAALGSSFGSANTLGLTPSPSSVPYVPADMAAPPDTPTSGVMYRSGRDTFMSDPFAYDDMVRSRAPTLTSTPHAAPFPSPGATWTNANSGMASPPALHISRTSSGIQTGPLASPYLSPNSLPESSATSPVFTQVPLGSAALQSDVSHALSQLQRRMSASTVATRFSQQTEYHRPPGSDDDRSFGYFMHGSPGGPQRTLPLVPRLKVSKPSVPETLQMQPTNTRSRTLEYGSPMYTSTLSVYDKYYQGSENSSRSRSGTRS